MLITILGGRYELVDRVEDYGSYVHVSVGRPTACKCPARDVACSPGGFGGVGVGPGDRWCMS
jgi:hypothetical protein